VFLSYHETYAETAYKRLQAKNDAHWVKDIEGIFSAHKKASETVSSAMFWVVDADAVIEEDFNFNYIPDVYDQEVVHVWASKNPITGDEYGYGGVKLFNTQQVREANSWKDGCILYQTQTLEQKQNLVLKWANSLLISLDKSH
jgi:hypothetical protein